MNIPESQIIPEDQTIWGLDLQAAGCLQCGQAHLVFGDNLGKRCPYCGKGKLEPQPARMRPEAPELVIPFRKQPGELKTLIEAFVKPVWMRPAELDVNTLASRAAQIFLPMWLVDADLNGEWQAEMGYDYQVKSSQDSFNAGRWHSKEVIETRIRWEPRLGEIQRRYENVAAPALSDWRRVRSSLGSFQHADATSYDPNLLGNASLRVPDLPPESAWPLAQNSLDRDAGMECQQAAEAQHERNFAIKCAYENLNWTQLLQPVYATYYTDDNNQPQMIFINGQTGKIGGKRLASQKKGWLWGGISLLIAAFLFVIGAVLIPFASIQPLIGAASALLVLLSLVVGIFAIITVAWPWQWNRKQFEE